MDRIYPPNLIGALIVITAHTVHRNAHTALAWEQARPLFSRITPTHARPHRCCHDLYRSNAEMMKQKKKARLHRQARTRCSSSCSHPSDLFSATREAGTSSRQQFPPQLLAYCTHEVGRVCVWASFDVLCACVSKIAIRGMRCH